MPRLRSLDSRPKLIVLILTVGAVLAATVGAVVLSREDGPLPPCDLPSESELESTVEAATAWLERSLQSDGTYWYEYDRATDEFAPGYHDVRHSGVTMSLYQVAAGGNLEAASIADQGREYIDANLVTDGDLVAFGQPHLELHLGSTALTIAGLVHRRIATGDNGDDELLRAMGRWMQLALRDDGGMWFGARYQSDASGGFFEPTVGKTSTFYTGEAFWAFGLLANQFPDEGWDDSARSVASYIATQRDIEEEIDDPPLADQWSAYGFAEIGGWGDLEADELAYVRSLIDQYGGRLEREIRREAKRVGDGTNEPDESKRQARGAAFGTTVEALASLWRLSAVDPGLADLNGDVRDDLVCGAAILAARQYDPARAAAWPQPDVVEGAWFLDDVTRMDDQQHAMSGVLLAIEALSAR